MDSGLLHYLLFSGSRRSGRGTFHARCGDGEPAGYCCHLHSPNLGRGQRGKGLREWGLPRVSEEAYLAGAMQDAVGRSKEGAKTREHLRGWVGVPRAWLGTLEWSPSPPTLHPPFSPPNLPSYPQKQPCICALSTATQTPLSNSRSHKGKGAEKTGTPPPTPAPSRWDNKSLPLPPYLGGCSTSAPLPPPLITLSSHGETRAKRAMEGGSGPSLGAPRNSSRSLCPPDTLPAQDCLEET